MGKNKSSIKCVIVVLLKRMWRTAKASVANSEAVL